MDDEKATMMRAAAMRMGILMFAMRGFAVRALALAADHNILTDEILSTMKRDTITAVKNYYAEGLSIDAEAEIFGQAIDEIEQLLDITLVQSRKNQ